MPKFTKGSKAAKEAGRKGALATNAKRRVTKVQSLNVPQKYTHYMLLVDKSGSMSHLRTQVIEAVNKQIETYKATQGSIATASIYQFGYAGYINKSRVNVAVGGLNTYQAGDYYPDAGATAILDALRVACQDLEASTNQSRDYANLVIVITDGEENASRYDEPFVKAAIARLTATDRYTFAGVGPKGCESFFTKIGIPIGNVQVWEQTQAGAETMGNVTRGATMTYASSRASGQTSTKSLFTPNLATLKTKTVKAELTNRSKDFKPWTVDKEVDIKTFVESHNVSFVLGAGYYPLTKPEKVQKTKQIVLVKKGTKEVYAGAEARELLGLPDEDTKVTPGNHGDWDIYVQSTSHNRKLVRGTKLLWDLTHTVDSKHTWADPSK